MFSVNAATNALSPVPGSPFPVGSPESLTLATTGNFLFVTSPGSTISVFAANPLAGTVGSAPVSSTPISAYFGETLIDSTGQFVVFNDSYNTASMFKIDVINGSPNAGHWLLFYGRNSMVYSLALRIPRSRVTHSPHRVCDQQHRQHENCSFCDKVKRKITVSASQCTHWSRNPAGQLPEYLGRYSWAQGLTLANDGNFYGACYLGGANSNGFIYRATPVGVLTDIYDFTGTTGGVPLGAPVLGADGNLYGSSGANSGQSQVIYRISTSGVYKLLYTMANGNSIPSFLSAGSDGNFYGTVATADGFGNVGGVFRINSAGTFTLINGFVTSTGVYYPDSGVILATNGKLYGTTAPTSGTGDGTIYDVTAAGVVTDLFNMGTTTPLDGGYNNLLQASNGNFYGASEGGGSGNMGGLFELTSANVYSSYVYSDQTVTGSYPQTPLMQHTNGTVFGANSTGGPNFGEGTFFSLNIGASQFISLVTPVAAGKEGAQVGILGQGFSKSSVVKFGGVAATKTVPSGSTFILATVPSGALTGTVTVTTGTTTLSTKATYKITPTILSFSPTSGHVGASVTITGTGFTQTTKVTFNNVSASFTVNSDTQITATVPTGATTGKIGVVTKGGTAVSATNFTVN